MPVERIGWARTQHITPIECATQLQSDSFDVFERVLKHICAANGLTAIPDPSSQLPGSCSLVTTLPQTYSHLGIPYKSKDPSPSRRKHVAAENLMHV